MLYIVSCRASAKSQCMLELLALPVELRGKSQLDGETAFSYTYKDCTK